MTEKKYIIEFLKGRKRGVYALIVNTYMDVISNMTITMALKVIKDDLEKEAGATIELNYFSLAKAISKVEKKPSSNLTTVITRKWEFKDAHEMKESQLPPGRFKLNKSG